MKSPRIIIIIVLALLVASLACSLGGSAAPTTEVAPAPTTQPVPEGQQRCGDGVCDGPENPANCPQDCAAATASPQSQPAGEANDAPASEPGTQPDTYWVTNPASRARLYVELLHPADWDGQALPTLLLIPGGTGSSADFKGRANKSTTLLADAGYAVVIFDPDGRGQSEGNEDLNGFTHQDGLAAVIQFAASLPEVDTEQMGLASFSYGITMASGVLARYPGLPIRFLMDWEGPADREDTTVDCSANPRIDWADCSDETFWAQREALTFIAQIEIPYQRLQSQKDHVQPDVSHAVNMVNAAIEGGVPWVRLNDRPPGQTFDPAAPPPMLPETMDQQLMELVVEYAAELFALP